ncbi:serine/threonine protein kinase [Actinomadura barringtoniae]|uniref:Serine/threonine protein kinase n=1 Tax=Actinomadura barringtoniae TaxID=1427535 RepID=A0A939TB56_9ACTN|nr:serine/threonine-protein kinase [Actinomadura barringtoniae]MBO2449800.1 serine/threonine protein kinase [Actinomadura barringtoniae]
MDGLHNGDPEALGGYALLGRLGAGGQGVVYLGRGASGALVAVKTLNAASVADPVARRRFAGEVALVRQVSSFCVAEIVDADLEGERPYIVSEYVNGPSLQAGVTGDGPLSGGALHRLAVGTMTALAAIHAAGIVHRDFKPHNVLLGRDGPRVVDFGIARLLDSGATVTGQVLGTVAYMSPEQASGGHVEASSDMFSWAGTMAFAAGGGPPFGRDGLAAVTHRIMYGEPGLPKLPAELDAVVRDCLAKDPRSRPAARDVLLRLIGDRQAPADHATLQGTSWGHTTPDAARTLPPSPPAHTAPTPMPPAAPMRRPRRRALEVAAVGGVVVLAAAIGTAIVLWPSGDGGKPPAPPAVNGTLLNRDDFSERAGWDGDTFNITGTAAERVNHGYELSREVYSMYVDKTARTNTSLSPTPPKNPPSGQAERNVVVGATVQIRRASGRGFVGLVCLWDEDVARGYEFLLGRDGTARIVRYDRGVNRDLGAPGKAVVPDVGRTVALRAACRRDASGTHVTFWVNNAQMVDATDSPGLPEDPVSQVGFYLQIPESSADGSLYASYDDFYLYRPA